MTRRALALAGLVLLGCGRTSGRVPRDARSPDDAHARLPTGKRLDPAGSSIDLGNLPLALAASSDHRWAIILLDGWREHGIQIVDRDARRVVQTVQLPNAFLGLALSADERSLFVSGGNDDVIYRFALANGRAALRDSIVLAPRAPGRDGTHYPAGIALSRDGRRLYVAENLADSLAVIDVASRAVVQRLATGRSPYGVAVGADGRVYVSAWGANTVSSYVERTAGTLAAERTLVVARHPSALVASADGARLFVASASTDQVAVVDTRRGEVVTRLNDRAPAGPDEGSTPNALALSADGSRLFVGEADDNAVAAFDLATGRLLGRIPVGWYPAALWFAGDTLLVVNAKGRGTIPNPSGPSPARPGREIPSDYTLGQLEGTLTTIPDAARLDRAALAPLSRRVARANGWDRGARSAPHYPPFRHVVYIIKENRTYDQVLGDLRDADGDSSLVFFPRSASPNHHALAERFGIYDRFFVNAEVSPDGHNWSMAAYVTDYGEKTISTHYAEHGGRSYDYEGTNGEDWGPKGIPEDDINAPAMGYLWNLAQRAGISFRNYGEFVVQDSSLHPDELPVGYRGTKPYLDAHTDRRFPGWNLHIRDQVRADEWIRELHEFERRGDMPQLEIVRLPNDHTSYDDPGAPTPMAHFADNDLALGRIIEALSRSPFWATSVVFVLEDDAQNGADHVDSHRSLLFVISPYGQPGAVHRFTNTTDVIATIAGILRLGSLSQYDFYGRPLREVFASTPDLRPYSALPPAVSLDDRNPPGRRRRDRSMWGTLDLRLEDREDDVAGNRILWSMLKGDTPYPGPTHVSAHAAILGR